MGGLGGNEGHLNHLYEDYNLTFGELKKILLDLSDNKITLYEKVDGQNLSLTYNPKTHQPMAARNKSDVRSGGVTLSKMSVRYSDKPGVRSAFTSAMKAFDEAVRTLTYYQRFQIFDPAIGGIPFANVEVMSTDNPNIIKYNGNYLVMHALSRFPLSGRSFACDDSFSDIVDKFNELEVSVDSDTWKIFGPKDIDLSGTMNIDGMRFALSKIDDLMKTWSLVDENTIRDFLIKSIFAKHASSLSIPDDLRIDLENRLLDEPGAKTTPSIVKTLVGGEKEAVLSLSRNRVGLVRESLVPIEMIINDFGLALLEFSHSSFVSNGEEQVLELREKVDSAIESLKNSDDPNLLSKIDLNWTKLNKTVSSITSTVEGVVFNVSGRSYKITGAFAPMNQILGWVNPAFARTRGTPTQVSALPIFMG